MNFFNFSVMKRLLFLSVFLLLSSAQGASVESIRFVGNTKMSKEALLYKLTTKVNRPYRTSNIEKDIKTLFQTGNFYDIAVYRKNTKKGVRLTFRFVEKPSISEIQFFLETKTQSKKFPKSKRKKEWDSDELDLDEIQEVIEVKPYETLNKNKLNASAEKIKKLYESKGFFLAQVRYEVQKMSPSKVAVTFFVYEGPKVKIKRIYFLGNKKIPTPELKDLLQTQEQGFFSFFSNSGTYQKEILDIDVQRLQVFYFDKGYVQAKIERPYVYITPDKKEIYITINIDEGEKYTLGDVTFSGDIIFSEEELHRALSFKKGSHFSPVQLQRSLRNLQEKYGSLGYAYVNVIPQHRILPKKRIVNITFQIEKGQKVYFNQINFIGNLRTEDKVLRRALKISEGELYNEEALQDSKANLYHLGFFSEVEFRKKPARKKNYINLDIFVKERQSGYINLNGGYNESTKLGFTGQVTQSNLFGTGRRLSFNFSLNSRQTIFDLSYLDPYIFDTEWSAGFDAYKTQQTRTQYEQGKKGLGIQIGKTLSQYLKGFISYKMFNTDVELLDGDPAIFPVDTVNGDTNAIELSLEYDRRDNRLYPKDGFYGKILFSFSGLGGDHHYIKNIYNFRYYKKVFWNVIFRNNLTYGFLKATKNDSLPFNELFLLGGANTLRGYSYYSVGKRKFSEKAFSELIGTGITREKAEKLARVPFGGKQQIYYNMEFQFPLIKDPSMDLSGLFFFDIGYADDKIKLSDLRSDVGFGFRLLTPVGPIRLEFAVPIDRDPDYEKPSVFQFHIGSSF